MHLPIPTHKRPATPGDVLLHDFLELLGVSQADFAKRIGVTPARLNEIIKGKRAVTPDTALRFERALGASAGFWLNLQLILDLYDAMHSESAKVIKKIKPITKRAA
jgi:addiction module HigA family antidote